MLWEWRIFGRIFIGGGWTAGGWSRQQSRTRVRGSHGLAHTQLEKKARAKGGCICVRSPGRGCNLQLASRQPGDFESDLILFFFIIANSTTTGPPLLPLSVSVSVSRSCFWYYQILAVSTFSFLFFLFFETNFF